MIRKYSLVIEGDAAGYSGYVPELPSIVVTGASARGVDRSREGSGADLLGDFVHGSDGGGDGEGV